MQDALILNNHYISIYHFVAPSPKECSGRENSCMGGGDAVRFLSWKKHTVRESFSYQNERQGVPAGHVEERGVPDKRNMRSGRPKMLHFTFPSLQEETLPDIQERFTSHRSFILNGLKPTLNGLKNQTRPNNVGSEGGNLTEFRMTLCDLLKPHLLQSF